MIPNLVRNTTICVVALSAFTAPLITATAGNIQQENTMTTNYKQRVVDLLKSIETGDQEPANHVNPNKYIQHNLAVADGLAGFGAVLQQLPKGSAKADTVRVFQDGDFVFTHTDYNFFGPKVGFDIFRFENGLIVEHWDNLQKKPDSPNPSGRTMLDNLSPVTDIEKTDANKTLVKDFVNNILVQGKMEKLTNYFDGDNYIQHNPNIADGLSGLGSALKAMEKQGITMRYDKINKVLGEGNFVLVASEGSFAGKDTAFYDLFRVSNGMIAEHWDTLETIPPHSEWKNSNGKF